MAANLGGVNGCVNNLRGVADLAARLKTHHAVLTAALDRLARCPRAA